MNKLECKNIKLSFYLNKSPDIDIIKSKGIVIIEKRTVFNVKLAQCSVTIYKHRKNSTLHVTGITDKRNAKEIKEFLENVFERKIIKIQIDNSLFSSKNNKKIELHKAVSYPIKNYSATYVSEIFPSVFFKPFLPKKKLGYPTILLFSNSSYIIIGAKNIELVKFADRTVKNMIKEITGFEDSKTKE